MLIDGDRLIAAQLSLEGSAEHEFEDERRTQLTRALTVPRLTGEGTALSLNGEWAVTKWPFARPEQALAAPRASIRQWQCVRQPGPVFFYDPDETPDKVKNWNRVTLEHVDPEDGAVIRRTCTIPEKWRGMRVYLRFDAIYPAGRVYLDGVELGTHLSGLTPVEYDVTDRVTPGEDVTVAVRLLRKHAFAQLDMVRHAVEFTGLAQDAYFHATGQVQISDYHLVSETSEPFTEGRIVGAVCVRNLGARAAVRTLKIAVQSPSGKTVARSRRKISVAAGATESQPVEIAIPDVALWNDEYPNLYEVLLTLEDERGREQKVRYRTGFRLLEVAPDGARLNGRPVKFRGVNHLTFHPEFGMHTPREWLRRNFELMKKANVNAIRTHFLGSPDVAELCSELGIYLLQELPIDWGTHFIHDPAWMGPILMRLEGGVRRDRHQPSVAVWSVGNENMPETNEVAADGWNHLRICDRFVKTLDPSRHTMFPPPGPANKVDGILEVRVGDIADIHYSFKLIDKLHETGEITNPRAWDGTMETLTREEAIARGWSGVWFSSEYGIFNMMPDLLNAPYLSRIADVEEDPLCGRNTLQVFIDRQRREWGRMRRDPTCLGGAYFPWLSSGAGKGPEGNPWGWVRWGEDADWGVITADLLPKPFFWAMRVLFSPVWFPARKTWKPGDEALVFEVTNQFNAIDLAECTLRTQMASGGKWMGQMRLYQDVPVECAPGDTREVSIPIWNPQTRQGLEQGLPVICRCHLLTPWGFRVLTHDILVIPEQLGGEDATAMPIGPDAVLA